MTVEYPRWMDYAVLENGVYVLSNDVPYYIEKEYNEYQQMIDEQFEPNIFEEE